MKSKLKKSLSLLLALVMAMSCMSLGAMAEGEAGQDDTGKVVAVSTTDELIAALAATDVHEKTIYVAEGNYQVSNNVNIKDGTTLIGVGQPANTVINCTKASINAGTRGIWMLSYMFLMGMLLH